MTYLNPKDATKQPQAQISEPISLTGSCSCGKLKYQLRLASKEEARTTLCHCNACKKAFGGVFSITVRVPVNAFRYTNDSGAPVTHTTAKSAGRNLYREFCNECGSHICEYGDQARDYYRQITLGSLDDPSALPPKGEFYCSQREQWLPHIEDIFHSQSGEH